MAKILARTHAHRNIMVTIVQSRDSEGIWVAIQTALLNDPD